MSRIRACILVREGACNGMRMQRNALASFCVGGRKPAGIVPAGFVSIGYLSISGHASRARP